MNVSIARILLLLLVLTLAVPESYAKRVGSGRSSGRQSQAIRKAPPARAAPAPAPAQPPLQRAQPAPLPPPAQPQHTLPRQANSPWGGMLGGALLGLGLGSMMSSGDRDAAAGTGQAAPNAGIDADAAQTQAAPAEPVPQNRLGPLLLLAVFAVLVFSLARRARGRRR